MQIEAKVSPDGIVTAKLPDRYRGRQVRLIIADEDEGISHQWAALAELLDRSESLAIPRRTHQQILAEVRRFRASA